MRSRPILVFAAILTAMVLCLPLAAKSTTGTRMGFVATVDATSPLAYYRIQSLSGKSEIGTTTYTAAGGVAMSSAGAPIGVHGNQCARLNGDGAFYDTTQMGGIATAGSIMAWVNLASLPSTSNRIFYVAGESQSGNDFDLQFQTDNTLHFFTAGGSNVSYTPDAKTFISRWHMVVATFDASSGTRAIYWDGALAASDAGGGAANKTHEFTIGESPVFTGRWFQGCIDDFALWNHALSARQVAMIYASRLNKP